MTDTLPRLSVAPSDIADVDLHDVRPWEGNPRRGDVEAIRLSLRRFGQQKPIVVQRSSQRIVAGNHLWHAMVAENAEYERLTAEGKWEDDADWPKGLRDYPDVLVAYSDLTDVEARAFLVTDNRMSELGSNDPEALGRWLADLIGEEAFDAALGYASQDVDKLLRSIAESNEPDDAPPLPTARNVWVKPGTLFAIGRHRLLVADATQEESYDRLLDGQEVGMIWTDPPYGVEYVGKTAEALTIANDESEEVGLRALLEAVFGHSVRRLRRGGAVYCAGPGGAMSRVFIDVLSDLGVYRQTIIWVKDDFVMGRQDYHWRHEQVFNGAKPKREGKPMAKASSNVHYGWRPGAAHYFVDDRSLDTVWEIPRPKASREHPTMKPVDLVERSILASSVRNAIVLDPFAGSGTTLVAAERTGRVGMAMELDPKYAQVIVERMQNIFGLEATVL